MNNGEINIKVDTSMIEVTCPYHRQFIDFAKSMKGKWNPKMRIWKFPKSKKREAEIKNKLVEVFGYDGRKLDHELDLDCENLEIKKYKYATIVKGKGFAFINYIGTDIQSVEQITERLNKETFRVTEFFIPDFAIPHFCIIPSKKISFRTCGIKAKKELTHLISKYRPNLYNLKYIIENSDDDFLFELDTLYKYYNIINLYEN